MDDVEDDEDVSVWVFAIPIRRSVDGVVLGSEKREVRDCVVGVI
jgi:hypothetical protein